MYKERRKIGIKDNNKKFKLPNHFIFRFSPLLNEYVHYVPPLFKLIYFYKKIVFIIIKLFNTTF